MNILTKFNQAFGLTQTESRLVLFLVIAFVCGIVIKLYTSVSGTEPRFSYAAADSEFAARSLLLASDSLSDVGKEPLESESGLRSSTAMSEGHFKPLPSAKLDINTASKTELMQLPGVGEVMAARIILYREEHGRFRTVDELMKVKGIGKKKFEQIVSYCTVRK